MSDDNQNIWLEINHRYLMAAIDLVRTKLLAVVANPEETEEIVERQNSQRQALLETAARAPASPALETLVNTFNLSPFERDILVLCAGVEFDASFAGLCAAASGDNRLAYPTFGLALSALPDAHWSALSPGGALRYWRLLDIQQGDTLNRSRLRLDERVLHYLTGVQHLDERLLGLIAPIREVDELVPTHERLAGQLAATWAQVADDEDLPAIQLTGKDSAGKWAIAAAACNLLGLDMHQMPAHVIPTDPAELEAVIRLWSRESILSRSALLLDCDETNPADAGRENLISRLIDGLKGPLIVTGREKQRVSRRAIVAFAVGKPTAAEQQAIWLHALGAGQDGRLIAPDGGDNGDRLGLDGTVGALVSQFDLGALAIRAASRAALGRLAADDRSTGEISPAAWRTALWDASRLQAQPRLGELAQPIKPVATWDELVLPAGQREVLREIAIHIRHRLQVYETWGFAGKGERGLGISALFVGSSGTGKTMAAEVLANELQLDLYRIDLSQVVSKYIGETEKNLRRVFDAAEEGGAILLFDEADALFGKRSDVKDSHDRYANIEISYLLQRMEAYRGLAILTSNLRDALDDAFVRRIRFIVRFPFPDAAGRTEIWRRIFPTETPTDGLDMEKLARLNVTGGNIRNIALQAAFLAADEAEPVRMSHLLRAARAEYAKLEKSLSANEVKEWV